MRQQPLKALTPPQNRYLLAALFITGAVTLVLEIAGTRVISPYYGSSLYTWSALITVTLVALAAGYNWGGRCADRSPSLTLFARLLCLAGAAVAFIPPLREPVLRLTAPFGVQVGALASATLLVAPALILLSALGPLAIRLTTLGLDSVGRRAGDVYALSTVGSVAGAVLAGFVLIPNLALSRIFYAIACLLLLLGALGYRLSSLRIPLPQMAAASIVALWGFWPRPSPRSNVLLNKDSAYGQIKVVDFQGGNRYLLVNGTSQSVALTARGESDSQYCRSLELAALLRPKAKRALVIGLGAGLLPGALERAYGLVADVVEIDPEIVTTARRFFGYAPKGNISVQDGRTYLERTQRRYGLVFLDAFGAESPPYHLFTKESFAAMHRALEPGGVLGVNIISLVGSPGDEAWLSTFKTLKTVFPHVRAFIASDLSMSIGNVLLFCSDAPIDLSGAAPARAFIRADIATLPSHELAPDSAALARVPVMDDDHAPLEFLLARTALRWRKSLQSGSSDLLLY